jgi:hypothetical protein
VARLRLTDALRTQQLALIPGLAVVALLIFWAADDGGYDPSTWYWGALVVLGLLAVTLVRAGRPRLSRPAMIAIGLLALYVGWSYLSITWAQSRGDALQGSNRALLYLLVFTLMLLLPWTARAALTALVLVALAIGVIGIVVLVRLATDNHVSSLILEGRLVVPTGYFNATAALFTIGALLNTGLAARRELPGPLRGLSLAFACSGLQLGLIVQSRGWLFTLPLVILAAICVSADRLRLTAVAVVPLAGALIPLHRLLDVYQSDHGTALAHAAASAGRASLLILVGVFVCGTLLAWGDSLMPARALSPRRRRTIGSALIVIAVAGLLAGSAVATHGHPVRFVVRQWNGFSKEQTTSSATSHFGDVGSGRYDFWRVSLDAFTAHPVGGLGQDNFADYYVKRRRTTEEPSWTHSLELRLLAHTGAVGFLLFFGFLITALIPALRARRRGDAVVRGAAGVALLPLMVWLIHGSVDWFWEMPALSGLAFAFLGMAGALSRERVQTGEAASAGAEVTGRADADRPRRSVLAPGGLAVGAMGVLALLAATAVLGIPYLSVRDVSLATDVRFTDPSRALTDLSRAAKLNPWNSEPGRLAGAIALQNGEYAVARQRFKQSINAEPGGWFSWLGAGLAASALGQRATARYDFEMAHAINSLQPAIRAAVSRVDTQRPLTSAQAFDLLVLAD